MERSEMVKFALLMSVKEGSLTEVILMRQVVEAGEATVHG